MHHGTLLWDADFGKMAGVLKPDETKLSSKGIKSVRSRVGNLKDLLSEAKKQGNVPHKYPTLLICEIILKHGQENRQKHFQKCSAVK